MQEDQYAMLGINTMFIDGEMHQEMYCLYLRNKNKPENSPPEIFTASRSYSAVEQHFVLTTSGGSSADEESKKLYKDAVLEEVPDLDCIKKEYIKASLVEELGKQGRIF